MKNFISRTAFITTAILCTATTANAWQYKNDRFAFKLTGYGTAGMIQPEFDKSDFLGDWRVRGQVNYAIAAGQSAGAVYAIDAAAIDDDKPLREAFGFYENRDLGRIEIGFTDSIARKLGVGLPDVGGMRINDQPLFYKKIHPTGTIISDTILTTGRTALRTNIVSVPTRPVQYGLSVAGLTDDYDYAIDAGIKIRRPDGKIKTAYSFGASFMSALSGYHTDTYTPDVTADWRAQLSAGMNLQYNSFVWGINARAIYDQNPIGPISDGISAGTGISYDLLKYTVSLSYIFSDTGVWSHDVDDYMDHTVIGSFRYKYSENVDGWVSIGLTTETPFLSAGMRVTF